MLERRITGMPEIKEVTFEEVMHKSFDGTQRWLYRLSEPIRYSNHADRLYSGGECTTEYVLVSWGREGDTCIFPAEANGGIADMEGFNGRMGWDEPVARLQEWIDGAVYGGGIGESFAAVRVR